jgi:hypothetical protein
VFLCQVPHLAELMGERSFELDADSAADVLIKWMYASLLRDENYLGNARQRRGGADSVQALFLAPGKDAVLPTIVIPALISGLLRKSQLPPSQHRIHLHKSNMSMADATRVESQWLQFVMEKGRELLAFKLRAWTQLLEEEERTGEDWDDESMRIGMKRGPKAGLVSLIQSGERGDEVHRNQIGEHVFNKLKSRYRHLGHDSKR